MVTRRHRPHAFGRLYCTIPAVELRAVRPPVEGLHGDCHDERRWLERGVNEETAGPMIAARELPT